MGYNSDSFIYKKVLPRVWHICIYLDFGFKKLGQQTGRQRDDLRDGRKIIILLNIFSTAYKKYF